MKWWRRLWGTVNLDAATELRLTQWRALPQCNTRAPLATQRLVVVDVESSGLDIRNDRLLSIGAVGVNSGRIKLDDTFHRLLRQEKVSARDNILIHGISPTQQSTGDAPAQVMMDFLEYSAKAPCVAYHAPFDRAMLQRETRAQLNEKFPVAWLDLAWLLPVLFPEAKLTHAPLDAWLQHFALAVPNRHRADVDALMTAELLLIALQRARQRELHHFQSLSDLALAESQLRAPGRMGGF